jgi:hypothetical protein
MEPSICKCAAKGFVDPETAIAKVYSFRKLLLSICAISYQNVPKTFGRRLLHIRQKFLIFMHVALIGNSKTENLLFEKESKFVTFMTDPCRLDKRRGKAK